MKLECGKEKLTRAITIAEKLTGKNLSLPLLKNILLTAEGDSLVARATNLELGVEITLPAKVKAAGAAAVPGAALSGFLSNLGANQKVEITATPEKLVLSAGPHSAVIKTEPHDDFPAIPKVKEGQSLKIAAAELILGLRSVMFAASASHIKPEIASVYVYSAGQELVFVATDSFRLAEKRIGLQGKNQGLPSLIIPQKNAVEILRVLESDHGEWELFFDDNQISLAGSGIYLTSRLVDGSFPDYKQIIPKGYQTQVVVPKDDLAKIIRLSSFFSDKFHRADWEIVPESQKLNIKTRSDGGESASSLDAAVEGEELLISFNLKYLAEALGAIGVSRVALQFSGPAKPILVSGLDDLSFQYLIMPINR